MRFGTYYFLQATHDRTPAEIIVDELDQMVLSESLGFDSVWLTEHHFSDYGLSAAPSVLAATLAARTSRVNIGTAVYVIPFHNPVRLAEETASLDILSGGRLVVGIGRGNRPLEFVGHQIAQDESRTRMEEGVKVLIAAWTQDKVTFNGRYWRLNNLPVEPKPVQKPHPPLAVAATSDESITWTARNGWRLLSSGLGTALPTLQRQRRLYREALRARGQPAATIEALARAWVVTRHVYLADSDAQARREAEPHERWYLDSFARSLRPDGLVGLSEAVRQQANEMVRRATERRWEDLIEDALLIGSPATVRQRVAELAEAGGGRVGGWMNFGGLPPDKVRRSMRLFDEEVMPAFRRTSSAA